MSNTVTLKIDGKTVSTDPGSSLMDAARENGFFIPGLCQFSGLEPIGACRLCIVEGEESSKLLPSCATQASEGMSILTDSEKVRKYRKMILELLFAERNHVCSICVASGHCELQSLAEQLGVLHSRYEYRYPQMALDASHRQFTYDPNRCILCTRCVRVCDDIEGAKTWDLRGRGINTTVMTDLNEPWGESETCTSCSKCVHVCPTGALFEKGRATGEMKKRRNVLPYLRSMRENAR